MAARTLDDRYRPFSSRFGHHLRSILGGAALASSVAFGTGCQLDLEFTGVAQDQGFDDCDDIDAALLVQQQTGFIDYRCEGSRYFVFESAEVVSDVDGECTVKATWVDESYPGSPCEQSGVPYFPGTAVDGRPLVVEQQARVARVRRGNAWTVQSGVQLDGLTENQRLRLAERWQQAALYEHASVASFARFTLDLMTHGAPPALLLAAQKAAADEVRHAQLCFGLAAAYGSVVEPANLELPGGSLPLSQSLVELAVDTAREGCIGETLAAVRAAEQLRYATDPGVQRVLTALVQDEGEHAELAWRTLRWAVDQGGEPVREALRVVFDEAVRAVDGFVEGGESDPELRAHGLLSDEETRRGLRRAMEGVILPAAQELLA
jgi:hypothetical protein